MPLIIIGSEATKSMELCQKCSEKLFDSFLRARWLLPPLKQASPFWVASMSAVDQPQLVNEPFDLRGGLVDYLSESTVTDCWIIGGDFNAVGGDGCLSPLESFQDTFHQSGSGWCNTGTSDYPLFRVDQIWVKGNVRSTVNKSFQTKHSDHRSVVADLVKFGE